MVLLYLLNYHDQFYMLCLFVFKETSCRLIRERSLIRELTIFGRKRRPRLHKTKTAITEIKAVQLCRKHNLKDLLSE